MLHEVRLAHAGGTEKDDVLFGVIELRRLLLIILRERAHMVHVVVMIADRNREHLLRFVLPDDKAIEMRLDIARPVMEFESARIDRRSGGRFVAAGFGGGRGHVRRLDIDLLAELRAHEFGQLALQLVRIGKGGITHRRER